MKNNEKSTESILLTSMGVISSFLVGYSVTMGMILLIILIILGIKRLGKNISIAQAKDFLKKHKDLADEINDRCKKEKILDKVNAIYKMLGQATEKIPSVRKVTYPSIDMKLLNEAFYEAVKSLKKPQEAEDLLTDYVFEHPGLLITFEVGGLPDSDELFTKFENIAINIVNRKIGKNYQLISDRDNYDLFYEGRKLINSKNITKAEFVVPIKINFYKELKLEDIVKKLKSESTENLRIDESMTFCEI